MPPEKARPLRLERGDNDFRVGIQRQITSRDSDIPAAGAPFRELVVGQSARRDGENGLPFERRIKQLENVGLARAGGRMHNHVLAVLQGSDGLLLPEIGYQQVDLQPHLPPKMKGSRARATGAFPRMWEPPWKARPRAPRCVTGAAKIGAQRPLPH